LEVKRRAKPAPIPAGLLKAVCEVGSFAGHGLQVMPTVGQLFRREYIVSQISDFVDKVLDKFTDSITDQVFLTIQEDRELMLEYLRLVSDTKLDTVNQQIGKKVRFRFNLDKAPRRQDAPKSTLIKSHQMFF
jgi:hypothetical protein